MLRISLVIIDYLKKSSGVKGSESHWAQAENESSDDDEQEEEEKLERRSDKKKEKEPIDDMDVEEGWSVAR